MMPLFFKPRAKLVVEILANSSTRFAAAAPIFVCSSSRSPAAPFRPCKFERELIGERVQDKIAPLRQAAMGWGPGPARLLTRGRAARPVPVQSISLRKTLFA